MAESTLSITLAELQAQVARFQSYGGTFGTAFSSLTAAQQAEVTSIIKRGLRQFYAPPQLPRESYAHVWSFLRKPYWITTNAPSVPTATVTVGSGAATMTGGTLASWIAGGVARFNGSGAYYSVSSRIDDTHFALDDTTVDVDAGSTVAFYDHVKSLPDDFGGIDGTITYGAGSGRSPLSLSNEARLRVLAACDQMPGAPSSFAIRTNTWPAAGGSGDSSPTVGSRMELMLWPVPDAAYALEAVYAVLPQALSATTDVPLGGMWHGETIIASCLAIAEEFSQTQHTKYRGDDGYFMQRLAASVRRDRQHGGEQGELGYNGDRSDDSAPAWRARTCGDREATYTHGV